MHDNARASAAGAGAGAMLMKYGVLTIVVFLCAALRATSSVVSGPQLGWGSYNAFGVHATDAELRDEYLEGYSRFLVSYRDASRKYRDGDLTVSFPPYSYRPRQTLEPERAPPATGP